MVDWPHLDRVIDTSHLCFCIGRERTDLRIVGLDSCCTVEVQHVSQTDLVLLQLKPAMTKDVDYLLIANPVVHLNHSGIRRDCAALFQAGRFAGSLH